MKHRTGNEAPDYIVANADMPLYVRLRDAIYGSVPPGQRNFEFDTIVPFPGEMHFFDMCLYDVAKRLSFRGMMDGLV